MCVVDDFVIDCTTSRVHPTYTECDMRITRVLAAFILRKEESRNLAESVRQAEWEHLVTIRKNRNFEWSRLEEGEC